MRLNFQQVRRSVIGYGGACAASLLSAALLVLSPAARAQPQDDAPAAPNAVVSVANAAPDVVPATPAALAAAAAASAQAPADPIASGNDGAFAGIGSLDDQTLARQRGGAIGMVMVAATPQLMRGGSVTLWDEIAPPAPLPIPVDATQNAQGNLASYTRK